MATDDTIFDAAATAFAQVQTTVTQLKSDYASVCAQIADTQSQLTAAPLAYIPLADLQAGILDFIDASGLKYAQDEITGTVSNFAQNYMSGNNNNPALAGKPLRFCDIEGAVNGAGFIQLLTPYKNVFNDQVLYYFFGQLVKQGLSALMADMPPEAFGYDAIHPDMIGTDRVTRRAAIVSLNAQLSTLQGQKADLVSKLTALGVRIPS
jgi:hypothetical protein